MTTLEPADRAQCQALKPNQTWSFIALGPADEDAVTGEKRGGCREIDRFWRCREKPVCIVTEAEPAEDGQQGEMSLCADCYLQLCFQVGPAYVLLKERL